MAELAAPTANAESTDSATSEAAQLFRKLITSASGSRSILADPYADARTEILEIHEGCSAPNWDGYGAAAIEPQALNEALFVLEKLLPGTIVPDVGPEPSGGIGFEWENDRGVSLIVSVRGDQMMAYAAALADGGRRRGNERFLNFFPLPVRELLENEFGERKS